MNEEELIKILQDDDGSARLHSLSQLRDRAPVETLSALISLLNSPEQELRRRAAGSLSMFRDHVEPKADILVDHLLGNTDPRVRLSCAIALMTVGTLSVTQAYVQALGDSSDRVVKIACVELRFRKGVDSTTPLMRILGHPSWSVRLEACKALIQQKTADQRVVSTLEQMAKEPEAIEYDAADDEMERTEKEQFGSEPPPYGPRWGKLHTILAQARAVADTN